MRRVWLVVFIGLLAACSSNAAEVPTTTTTGLPPSTATVTTAATTVVELTPTTEAVGQVDICRGRAELWNAGRSYVADCVALPVSFQVTDRGWRSSWVEEDGLLVSWVDPTDAGFRVSVGLSVAEGTLDGVVEAIGQADGVVVVTEPAGFNTQGLGGVVLDVEGEQVPVMGDIVRPCLDGASRSVAFLHNDFGAYRVTAEFGDRALVFGVGACQIARVWVGEVGGYVVSVIGGTADPARHGEAVAKVEELFEGMSFDGGAGS